MFLAKSYWFLALTYSTFNLGGGGGGGGGGGVNLFYITSFQTGIKS